MHRTRVKCFLHNIIPEDLRRRQFWQDKGVDEYPGIFSIFFFGGKIKTNLKCCYPKAK
jgi:hypothetical protein